MLREVLPCLVKWSMNRSTWYTLSALSCACISKNYWQEHGSCEQPCNTANTCPNECFAVFLGTCLPPCSEALGWSLRLRRLWIHLPKGVKSCCFSLIPTQRHSFMQCTISKLIKVNPPSGLQYRCGHAPSQAAADLRCLPEA